MLTLQLKKIKNRVSCHSPKNQQLCFFDAMAAWNRPDSCRRHWVRTLAKGVDNQDTASHADLGFPFDAGPCL